MAHVRLTDSDFYINMRASLNSTMRGYFSYQNRGLLAIIGAITSYSVLATGIGGYRSGLHLGTLEYLFSFRPASDLSKAED